MIWWTLLACGEPEPCVDPSGDSLGELLPEEVDRFGADPDLPAADVLLLPDGLPLVYRDFVPADWDGSGDILLFVPGSSSHSGNYGPVGQGLADRGVYARIVDLRGHGLSVCAASGCGSPESVDRTPVDDGSTWVGRIGDSLDTQQISRDLGHVVEDLQDRFPAATLHVGGHSSGGGTASRFVETTGAPGVERIVLFSPYNHPEQPQVRPEVLLDCPDTAGTAYAQVSLGALGDALRGNVHRYVLALNKSPRYTDPLDTVAYSYTTMVGMATTEPVRFWETFDRPVLLVAGSDDHLLDPALSAEQVRRAPEGVFVEVTASHIGLIVSEEALDAAVDFLVD